MSSQRRPLQRKDFNKLEDDNVLAKKRLHINQEQVQFKEFRIVILK